MGEFGGEVGVVEVDCFCEGGGGVFVCGFERCSCSVFCGSCGCKIRGYCDLDDFIADSGAREPESEEEDAFRFFWAWIGFSEVFTMSRLIRFPRCRPICTKPSSTFSRSGMAVGPSSTWVYIASYLPLSMAGVVLAPSFSFLSRPRLGFRKRLLRRKGVWCFDKVVSTRIPPITC